MEKVPEDEGNLALYRPSGWSHDANDFLAKTGYSPSAKQLTEVSEDVDPAEVSVP